MKAGSSKRGYLGQRFIPVILLALIIISVCTIYAQTPARKPSKPKREQSYTRPKPTVPIRPVIPGVNRYQPDKVFLERADSLYSRGGLEADHQIVNGNVLFRQGNMYMYCDSAYYYPELNSMDAFGHVKMTQGDTLFIYADKLYYDGQARFARLLNGPTQNKVTMKNRKVSLMTDSLDYDLNIEQGWYNNGGVLEDDVNTLTSRIGIYSPSTKNAEFYEDVKLVNRKDGYQLFSDTLYYNTDTHLARIETFTRILGANDTILTTRGEYNTTTGNADLKARSTILHRDSAGNVTTLEGDSIIYDKSTRISRAYAFRSPSKLPRPMVITDTARHTVLIGGFGEYNDLTREALAAEYPLMREFSTPGDTIFLRADTIRTFVRNAMIPKFIANMTDSLLTDTIYESREYHEARAYNRARVFKQDIQGVADSIQFVELDSMLYLYRGPILWSDNRQISGKVIEVHMNDSTADWARLPHTGMMMEDIEEGFFNQLAGKEMYATFEGKALKRLEVEGNVRTIFLPMENDSTYNRLVYAESSNLSIDMNGKEMERLKMWPEVTGDVTPIFLVKKSQQLLPGAEWMEAIRPRRVWLDTRWSWEDDLGELSPELEKYFEKVHSEKITENEE
ncbi:MAG: hypothetical protein K2N03_01865 [Muribaculaceae bacterium]|nr:hypothetical protein [Muribaculaceae bacterium]